MDAIALIACAVIITASVFDALRDAWMRTASWWKRHAVKWISFYLPLTYIMFRDVPWVWWGPLAIVCWVAWRMSLRYIGGVKWESMWVRWAKSLFARDDGRYREL